MGAPLGLVSLGLNFRLQRGFCQMKNPIPEVAHKCVFALLVKE